MIKNFDGISKQLRELADVINSFKSEAVQLRLIELIFGEADERSDDVGDARDQGRGTDDVARPPRRKAVTPKKPSEMAPARARGPGRPGAKATLARLLGEGYFKKPKTLSQLVEHCDHNLASKFKQSDFSGALARCVRDGKLKRVKNADKQYEYSQSNG